VNLLTLPEGFVIGDGSSAGAKAKSGWRRFGWLTTLIVGSMLIIVFLAVTKAPSSSVPLSINNAEPGGARAVAEILRDRGVRVSETGNLSGARSRLGSDGTLVIASSTFLGQDQIDSILGWQGPVLWLSPSEYDLALIDARLTYAWAGDRTSVLPQCSLDAAQRAESIITEGQRLSLTRATALATTCYIDGFGSGVFVQLERDGAAPMTVVAAPSFMTNADLALEGDAALALNLLGTRDQVAWYVGTPFDTSTLGGTGQGTGVTLRAPAWTNAAILALALTFLVAALWRGRRMGALVTEPLPVVVPSSEATRGGARLYRRGRAAGHASAALRAGVARRLSTRLGLGPHATPTEIVTAVSTATGRDSAVTHELLYGPPPRDESAMLNLVRRLDALESEVDPT